MELGGQWLSLMDYATQNDVSLSTLRRHIKARKVHYRTENGRYLIWSSGPAIQPSLTLAADFNAASTGESLAHLRLELQKAREEIAELKTLVAFYEDQSESLRVSS